MEGKKGGKKRRSQGREREREGALESPSKKYGYGPVQYVFSIFLRFTTTATTTTKSG